MCVWKKFNIFSWLERDLIKKVSHISKIPMNAIGSSMIDFPSLIVFHTSLPSDTQSVLYLSEKTWN